MIRPLAAACADTLSCVRMQDEPIAAVIAACEASERKLESIRIAELLRLTEEQLDAIMQLRSDFLTRCSLAPHPVGLDHKLSAGVAPAFWAGVDGRIEARQDLTVDLDISINAEPRLRTSAPWTTRKRT